MRILRFIPCFLASLVLFCGCGEQMTVKVYYADAQLVGLVPVSYDVECRDTEAAARFIADKLVEGMDTNPSVMRLIPKENGCMRVKLDGDKAYVDFSRSSWEALPKDRDRERLMVYQIVNSLSSLEGINKVQFSVEGELKTNPAGHIDLRDSILPDYGV